MIDDPKAEQPQHDPERDAAVPEDTQYQPRPKQCYRRCRYCCRKAFRNGKRFLKRRTAEQWLALGTWILAFVTVYAVLSAETALHESQRPWVVAESAKISTPIQYFGGPSYEIRMEIVFKNTGQSITTKMVVLSALFPNSHSIINRDWARPDRDLDKQILQAQQEPWARGIVLAPGQTILDEELHAFHGPDVDKPDVQSVRSGRFFFVGYVRYKDQFGLSHHARFSFKPRVNRETGVWDGTSLMVSGLWQEAD